MHQPNSRPIIQQPIIQNHHPVIQQPQSNVIIGGVPILSQSSSIHNTQQHNIQQSNIQQSKFSQSESIQQTAYFKQ